VIGEIQSFWPAAAGVSSAVSLLALYRGKSVHARRTAESIALLAIATETDARTAAEALAIGLGHTSRRTALTYPVRAVTEPLQQARRPEQNPESERTHLRLERSSSKRRAPLPISPHQRVEAPAALQPSRSTAPPEGTS
jgi:hypothetical protein